MFSNLSWRFLWMVLIKPLFSFEYLNSPLYRMGKPQTSFMWKLQTSIAWKAIVERSKPQLRGKRSRSEMKWNFETCGSGGIYMYMWYLWTSSVQDHFGVIRCTRFFPKTQPNLFAALLFESSYKSWKWLIAEQTGVKFEIIVEPVWSNFDLGAFKVIWGSFGSLGMLRINDCQDATSTLSWFFFNQTLCSLWQSTQKLFLRIFRTWNLKKGKPINTVAIVAIVLKVILR